MVDILKRFKIFFLALIFAQGIPSVSAQPKQASSAPPVTEPVIPRVIVLLPTYALQATPQVQRRIDQERAARSKARSKSRLHSAASKASPPASSVLTFPGKAEYRVTPPETNSTLRASTLGNTAPVASNMAAPASGKTDTVPPEQRVTLAQALLVDSLIEHLQDRLELIVVSGKEAALVLQALHLTPEQAMQTDNARKLCARLNCQAVLMPHVTACTIREGATRDAAVFANIRIAGIASWENEPLTTGMPDKLDGSQPGGAKRRPLPTRNVRHAVAPDDAFSLLAHWPVQLEAAGTALADRVLFHKKYQKPQGDLIRDAAQRTVNLLVHALRVGEQAPFMRPTDRIALTPVLTPQGADKLIFTSAGRRVVPASLTNLHAEIYTLFLPDLLPIAPDRVIAEDEVRNALSAQGIREAELWASEDQPALVRVQALGRRLHTDYVLLTRVTDVELSESAQKREPNTGLVANTPAGDNERAVRVEATAALARVSDGVLLWHDRAIATMTASPSTTANKPQTNESLTRDATHFALVELQRRLRQYRSTFEK